MRRKKHTGRILAIIVITACFTGDVYGTGITTYASELISDDSLIQEDISRASVYLSDIPEDADEVNADMVSSEPSAASVAYQTGVATVGEFVPYGKALAPMLNAFGASLNSGTSTEDVSKAINSINKEVNGLSVQLSDFRSDMDQKMNELKGKMSKEINTALDKVRNNIFINGVGSELDILHTQVSGIAARIDTITGNSDLSEQAKAIEIASQIGDYRDWDDPQNALYRFNNLSDLLAGSTYRDTNGRNLYKVLYDNAALDSMFSSEAYDRIDPYMERVVYEYWYSYTVLAQCLSAHLTVSRMTDDEARALGDTLYHRYKDCKTRTSLVKDEVDGINKELLDADDASSVISMYSSFKYKKDYERYIFIDGGKTEIAVSDKLVKYVNPSVSKTRVGNSSAGVLSFDTLKGQWYLNSSYRQYYADAVAFVEGKNNLETGYIKDMYEHVLNLPSQITFYNYVVNNGFSVPSRDGFLAIGSMNKSPVSYTQDRYWGCLFNYPTFYLSMPGNPKTERDVCSLGVSTQTIKTKDGGIDTEYTKNGRKYWTTHNYVYCTPSGTAFLGFEKVNREQMPSTAQEVLKLLGKLPDDPAEPVDPADKTEYSVSIGDFGQAYELYQQYDLGSHSVTFKTSDGKTISPDKMQKLSDGRYYDWQFEGKAAPAYSGGNTVIFHKDGPCRARVYARNPEGKNIYSEWKQITVLKNHVSDLLKYYYEKPRTVNVGLNTKIKAGSYLPSAPVSTLPHMAPAYHTYFESMETPSDGIELNVNTGEAVFTKSGTYHIRVKALEYLKKHDYAYSKWVVFTAKAPDEPVSMVFLDSDGTKLHEISNAAGTELEESEIPDGVEFYWRNKLNLNGEEDDVIPQTREGFIFDGWDLVEDTGMPDGEAEEVPLTIPEGDMTYVAIWKRTIKDGYITVENASDLKKAISETPAGEMAKIAFANDITLDRLDLPKSGASGIVIDGMGHTLVFTGNVSLKSQGNYPLAFEDINIKAEDAKGKAGNIVITAGAGGLTLDKAVFTGRNINVNASKGSLTLKDIMEGNLTVKGSPRTSLTLEGRVTAGTIAGFGNATLTGSLTPVKILKVKKLNIGTNGVLNAGANTDISISAGISGAGTIRLSQGFKPIKVGKSNSGSIVLASEKTIDEYTVIFNSSDKNIDRIFETGCISPEVTDGNYGYGLKNTRGRVCLRAFKIRCGSKTYCEWKDCIADINKEKTAAAKTVTLLGNIHMDKALTLPAKGKCTTLTINGNGHILTFAGRTVTIGCDLVLKSITLSSANSSWVLKQNGYKAVHNTAVLNGCTVR